MKSRILFVIVLIFSGIFSTAGWAINNPAIGKPIGPATVPPSSISSGLVRSPNPVDVSGNLVITGNVAGGRYFRGVVPYNAITDFGGSLGSTSMDSFLRYSMDTGDFGRYTGRPTPYYSSMGTVTTTRPGQGDILRPPSASIDGHITSERSGSFATGGEALSPYSYPAVSAIHPVAVLPNGRPLSMTAQELERMLSSEIKRYAQDGREDQSAETAEQYEQQVEQFRQQLKKASERAEELKREMKGRDESLILRPQQAEKAMSLQKDEGQIDVYEQMKQQIIDDIQKGFEYSQQKRLAAEQAKGDRLTEGRESREPASQFALGTATKSSEQDTGKESSQAERFSKTGMSVAKAKSILGEHKSFASLSRDKFNEYMRIAEDYLKQGKYYLAADSYTLASIYKPDDPLAYAGKSYALFAAGEYMSSALFLSRALEIFPDYVRFKVDIEAMVGDRDRLESRIADIQQWLEKSSAAELQFLLGYVYYQMGRLEPAKKAIDAACEGMPRSRAVIALKEAIESASR